MVAGMTSLTGWLPGLAFGPASDVALALLLLSLPGQLHMLLSVVFGILSGHS